MKNIRQFVKNHKIVSVLFLFFFILFVLFSITNAIKIGHERAATQQQQEKEAKQNTETGSDNPIVLTDKQQELIDNYDAETQEFIDSLSKRPWVSEDGKNTIRFYDTYFEESVNGHPQQIPFAISAIDYGSDGGSMDIDTLAVETDKGTHLVTYMHKPSVSVKEDGFSTLASPTLFNQPDASYKRVESFTNIQIQGMNDEAVNLLGGTDELTKQLSEWCATSYPSMTTAIWNHSVTVSFDDQTTTVTSSFFLSQDENVTEVSPQSPAVTVIFNREKHAYTFKM